MSQKEKSGCFIPDIISLLVVSFVGPILSTSDKFVEFSDTMGIESDFGVKLLAGSITILVGGIVMISLRRLSKTRK
ncbi:MAG: hypothetical protein GY805_37765 [Chloroflexi bacterium]|nr:hypothetical protein [Chloroflexota bacterium]